MSKYSKKEVETFLEKLHSDTAWHDKYAFQEHAILNAAQRLKKRMEGWMMHKKVWDDSSTETLVEEAFDSFEEQHFRAYNRWTSVASAPTVGDKKNRDLSARMQKLFLYYLVYGEVHDTRNIKNVLHLLFHATFDLFLTQKNAPPIADWLRGQSEKLYRLMNLVYNKEEMLQDCFHHDDLDDTCATSKFVKKFWESRDVFKAFDLQVDGSDGKQDFPALTKILALDTPTFILRWVKSVQGKLNDKQRDERAEWIKKNFITPGSTEETKYNEMEQKITEMKPALDKAEKVARASEEELSSSSDHWRPTESDYDHKPDKFNEFRTAYTQYETSKELLAAARRSEKEGDAALKDAKVKHFRKEKDAAKSFDIAIQKYDLAERDYEEAQKGFSRAAEGFKAIDKDCNSYLLESNNLKNQAEYLKLNNMTQQFRIHQTRTYQFAFEEVVTKERAKFAKKNKTYFEKAGGPGGLYGYLTIFYHYSQIIYLHLFLVFPLAWLYYDYQDVQDFPGDLFATDIDSILSPAENAILFAGLTVFMIILAILLLNCVFRWRLYGKSAPGRGQGTPKLWGIGARIGNMVLWILCIITELVVMKLLVLNPLKSAADETLDDVSIYTPFILLVLWLPAVVLYLSSLQFVFTLWIGIFGLFFGLKDRAYNTITWRSMLSHFEGSQKAVTDPNTNEVSYVWTTIPIAKDFCETMLPKDLKLEEERKNIAFAKVWNVTINYFYDIHKVSKEELQKFTFKITFPKSGDFLSGRLEKMPDLLKEPEVKEVREHLIRFVNNIRMKNKPREHLAVAEMLPLTIVTPVGAEAIIYPFEFITHVDNTHSSFLQHLMESSPAEWGNFRKKECSSPKAADWVNRLEKDIFQAITVNDQSSKRKQWIHDTSEGQALKAKLCEWASIRFQALFRTVNGFMQVPIALEVLARIENPTMKQKEAKELVKKKFTYLIGYQSFANSYKIYRDSKFKIKEGLELEKNEIEAHYAVYNIKYIKKRFPEVRIAYPDVVVDEKTGHDKYIGKLMSGMSSESEYFDYRIELFGPFIDLGLGKPTHQNFLSQFIDGLIIQTIDVNQDNVLCQSFFLPNVVAEFSKSSKIKVVGCPEFVVTTNWSSTAWCSAFAEHNFGTLVQRTYARFGIRLHYGHPDYMDALFIMTETGLSKMSYVSEDIFTGFDCIIKGGKIAHIEYHEVGKARDVDLYTTTKFQRKISMGASQMACSRYINQLQRSKNVSYFQSLSFYYSTVGFYVNHQMLYLSVWFALVSQLVLVVLQILLLGEDVNEFISSRVFFAQVGYALVVPGLFQLMLEKGIIKGAWEYISHFFILSVYATFHILNVASYWQFGLTSSAFYLASGRGTGLEHYFMKDMYDNFFKTHWKPGFIILWMGLIVFFLSFDFFVFVLMYLAPSGVWLWGAMFLNPGSLPTTVHEEQWKRLTNRDMAETKQIVKMHTKLGQYDPPIQGNVIKRFFVSIGRLFRQGYRILHWVYYTINFNVHIRVVRVIAIFTMLWGNIFASKIPTFIFHDERTRVLRWDEDDTRQKSIFYSSMNLGKQKGKEMPSAYTQEDPEEQKDKRDLPAVPVKPNPPKARFEDPNPRRVTFNS